jgi:hypothetical protein
MKTLADLIAVLAQAHRVVQIQRGATRNLRPVALDRAAAAAFDAQLAIDTQLQRHVEDHAGVARGIRHSLQAEYRGIVGIGLSHLRAIGKQIEAARAFLDARRRDTSLSFPDALTHLTPGDKINYKILEMGRSAQIAGMGVAELARTLDVAYAHPDDATAMMDASLIEQRLASGTVTAKSADDLPRLRALRLRIEEEADKRVADAPDVEQLAHDVAKLASLAEVAQVRPLDPNHPAHAGAVEAYRALEGALLKAGEASDADDLRAVHQSLLPQRSPEEHAAAEAAARVARLAGAAS